MSIHLFTVPLPLDVIDNAMYLEDISASADNMNFKSKTLVDDMNLLEDIMQNSLLGFKNKRALTNFRNQGVMYFYFAGNTIEIAFIGNYPKDQTTMFLENINREYLQRTHRYVEETEKQSLLEKINESPKTLRITTSMKDIDLLKTVQQESFIGFNSQEQLQSFENIGQIVPNKNENGTYDMVFIGDYDEEEAKRYVDNLVNDYALKVQEQTYLKILDKIKKNNYSLESEIVDNQYSIVLTLNID